MVEIREQIKNMLMEIETNIEYEVKMQFPQSFAEGNLITFFELTNESTNIPCVDKIAFQIDIWTYDIETMVELSLKADEVITRVGFLRKYVSPDIMPTAPGEYCRKTLRYGRKVDTRTNRLID